MVSEENMKVCVYGLGHLGFVTAAGLASVGHEVVGIDPEWEEKWIDVDEPGLDDLIHDNQDRLTFAHDVERMRDAEVVWITFDTPVDDNDQAAVQFVVDKIIAAVPMIPRTAPIIVSSQLPVGTIHRLELAAPFLTFVCIPENLRHGTALENFLHPDRVVIGVRHETDRRKILELLIPIVFPGYLSVTDESDRIVWMSIESAEMTKHAINAFLAMSIAFINEIAAICEVVGADPAEVERGLKTEARIGPKAYLKPGGPYTGKTLARDVEYLRHLEINNSLYTPVIDAIGASNYARGHITIHGSIKMDEGPNK
jgi:UDPglucose 6-dehydrogenase